MNSKSEVLRTGTSLDTKRFRLAWIPATILFFAAFLTASYGAMIVPNILRDASNGYDGRYLMMAFSFPASLFGFAICCLFAGRSLVLGRWRNAAVAAIPAVACVMIVGFFTAMLR
ncbi:MAG: hypothetical protein KDA83_21545 [Planctomycetales bacterium]|nr:hypothetical protein [Planctomycetales bacterium]